jgi:tetratricopeptide (TPR) repeat protein
MTKLFSGLIIIYLLSINPLFAQDQKTKDEVFLDKGISYFDAENYKYAIMYFDSAVVINTENEEAYAFRGISKFMLEQYNEAVEDFDLCLILAPGYAEIYYYRGLSKLELKADKKACEDLYLAYDYGFKKAMKVIKNVCKDEVDKKKQKK